jgi:hypothetical protein
MYLLYIDESDTTDSKNELTPRWYCIAGTRIVDSSYRPSLEKWENLLRENNMPLGFELKGEELYQGTGFWKKHSPKERVEFSNFVCGFINSVNIKIYACLEVVVNSRHIDSYKNLLSKILNLVPKDISSNAPKSARQLILVFDQRLDIGFKIRQQIRDCRTNIIKNFNKSCAFIDYGFDSDSKLCWGIQIADFVAYLLRKQQTFQRENNLFNKSDNSLSFETVDNLISSIKDKCRVKYFSKKSF